MKATVSKLKEIGIAYDEMVAIAWRDLHDFQGDLKELSEASYHKLSTEIKETGFAFAPHVWKNPVDRLWYKVDCHQRVKTVLRMVDEGVRAPKKVPCVPVKAKSMKEAKRRVLQASSQYGEITKQGLFDFMKDAGVDFDDFRDSFEFPTIDLEKFTAFFDDAPAKQINGDAGEVDAGQFSKLVHTCPKCGHKFARE